LGEDKFVDGLADLLKKLRQVPEIPRGQRYANRPTLEKISQEGILSNKRKRDEKIAEAVERYAYRQSEIARHLSLHVSTVSNILRDRS
jgi:ActR/RegA family two-component response regulator